MIEWNNINIIFPPANEHILVCYKEINRSKVGVFYWFQAYNKRIWIGSIKEHNILYWASLGEIPMMEPIDVSGRVNLEPIDSRFEILDL